MPFPQSQTALSKIQTESSQESERFHAVRTLQRNYSSKHPPKTATGPESTRRRFLFRSRKQELVADFTGGAGTH